MPNVSVCSSLQSQIIAWDSVDDMMMGFPLIRQLYPDLTQEHYHQVVHALVKTGYRQFTIQDADGECLGLIGLRYFPRVWCGLQAEVDNFVVHKNHQSKGIGKLLLDRCTSLAIEEGANFVTLDTKVENTDSQRFYYREGFIIRGFHYLKCLTDETTSLL